MRYTLQMIKHLSDIAIVMPGYSFRKALPDSNKGKVSVVQLRDIDDNQVINWSTTTRTTLPENARRSPNLLIKNDILFAAKGRNFKATFVSNSPVNKQTICSPHFFHIRINNPSIILPEYLAWFINHKQTQQTIRKTGGSIVLTTVRKEVIEKLDVIIPPIEIQQQLINLESIYQQEKMTLEKLIRNRKKTLDLASQNLFQIYQQKSEKCA